MTQNLRNIKANAISRVTENITTALNVGGNLLPTSNVTYDLGSSTARWKDLYLSNNTIYLGDTVVSANSILPINLTIAPEVLTIQVDATEAGDDIHWLWTWQQSTLPYARATITNVQQPSVPLYKKGTYTINNFAAITMHGAMTQTHHGYFKWIDGAGFDNLIDWAGSTSNVATITHPDINGGAATQVQQYIFTVPENITIPTLNAPNIIYNVSFTAGQYYIADMAGEGSDVNIGPIYRGGTYTFNLDSSLSGHKFYLTTDNGTGYVSNGYVGEYTNGVTGSRGDGSTGKTTLTFVVPSNAPDTLFYQSATDANVHGAITIKDLAVETNINGNYVVYFQHTHEGHKTPIELRPIPSLVNQMCVVYDASVGKFVPQDLATYVENTPSFKNKIREVAGTATLIAPNGVAVVPTVLVVEDVSYLPLVNNKEGDIAFDAYTDSMYVWHTNSWRYTKPTSFPAANVVGTVANATYSITAGTASSVSAANITGTINLATFATTANSVAGANVTGQVANALVATTATTANSVAGANVTGTVANATYAITSGTSYSVAAANITGTINLATFATTANAVAGANVSGQVSNSLIAGTVYTAAQPNITSVGTLTALSVTGNITGANLTGNHYGNHSGNGSALTSITAANITGTVANATYAITAGTANSVAGANVSGQVANALVATTATTANSVAGANVTGQVANALIAGTVTTAAQPNITSHGTLTSLTVNGNVTLGNVANVHITGGTSGQVLATDGTGNLTFSTVASAAIPDILSPFLMMGA